MSGLFKKSKPVKLRGLNETKKYGIAAKNLAELLKKGCKLLKVPLGGSRVCVYADGTEVTEEYFHALPDNTELVLLSGPQTWSGVVCDIDLVLSADRHSDQLIQAAKGLLSDEQSPKRRKLLADLLLSLEDSSELESREDDEDWFKGVDTRFKTKSAYMRYNCENRIRGYVKEVDGVTKSIQKPKVMAEFVKTKKCLMDMLKSANYNGCYFDRTEKEANRLCTPEGWFTCQGAFDQDLCSSLHSINPYGNRESRVVFSTWNLDHRIEKKRTVIPALLEAVQNHKSSDINLNYFYQLLFTRENLKLVHIVCHKKGAHNLVCDNKKIFKRVLYTGKAEKNAKAKRLCRS
ncbi:DNA fragmentation factor subunit beta [Myripristis murdjan]|uniref:DNA fragmentation factor subunit beta n=1 Tax=Myripristis murdjan TaxID=586833 RepID=A0A667W872_9TELE|nr:DNA fragmentation factor subunit beta [Myripristis murdjan]XP_029910827.1 DNA fragmentation factor subunit beta [Myripristis murdjan]